MSDINAVARQYLRELRERREQTPAVTRSDQTVVSETVSRADTRPPVKHQADERYERLFRLAVKSLERRETE